MMQGCCLQPRVVSRWRTPFLGVLDPSLCSRSLLMRTSAIVRYRCMSRVNPLHNKIVAQASNINVGAGGFDESQGEGEKKTPQNGSTSGSSSNSENLLSRISYPASVAAVLLGCALAFSLIVLPKGNPSKVIAAIAKSGFTAAFTLIFVSEIGDKTFFIAALLAMQYKKALVLIGSMGALALMTVLSVIIGRIFHSVPAQFQTTLPIGEYAAVALLIYYGLTSIKNAWDLPTNVDDKKNEGSGLGELVEAEEIVKEKVSDHLRTYHHIYLFYIFRWKNIRQMLKSGCKEAHKPSRDHFKIFQPRIFCGMGRSLYAGHYRPWCCPVSIGGGRRRHCRAFSGDLHRGIGRSVSGQVYLRETGRLPWRSSLPRLRRRHAPRSLLS